MASDPADLAAFRDEAARWIAAEAPDPLPHDLTEAFPAARAWQRKLFDAGWLGLSWPAEYGGRGMSPVHQIVFDEELTKARAPMPAGTVSLEVIGPTIVRFGTDAQKKALIRPLLSGEDIWCQGFSEPDAGSDLAALRTRAVRRGDVYVVNGRKVWTTMAHLSTWCALLAKTGDGSRASRNITYLLVPMDSPGISVRPLAEMTGDVSFSEVTFDDTEVPADNVLGAAGGGWLVAMSTLEFERGPYVLRRYAEVRAMFADLVADLRASSLACDPVVTRRIGECDMLLEALRARCDRIVGEIAHEALSNRSSLDKLFLEYVSQEIFGFALDCTGPNPLGSRGTVPHSPRWAREYLYSRAASIYGGTTEIQRNIVAKRLLDLPMEPK
jgi:alkylation response protein AidB-like acyl-CoA dehydrogenase